MMKKISLLVILLTAVLLLSGCGKEKVENVEGTLTEIMEKVYKDLPANKTPSGLDNINLNEANIEDFIGTSDIEYTEAMARESMTGSIAHSTVLIRTKEDADIESIKEKNNPE